MEKILAFLRADSAHAHRIAWALLALLAAAMSTALWVRGCSPVLLYPNDVAIQLEGGWRVHQGQQPHTDFYSPIGPLILWITALGLKLRPTADAIAGSNAVLVPVLVAWAAWIASPRMPAFFLFWFALFVGLLVAAPRYLDASPELFTYGTLYNRYGYALLAILVAELFAAPPRKTYTGVSSGVILVLLLFTKLNYFGIGAAAVALRLVLFERDRRWMAATALGAIAAFVAGAVAIGDIGAFFSDMARVSAVQETGTRLAELQRDAEANLWIFAGCALVLVFARADLKARLVFAFLIVSALALLATNAESQGLPLAGVGALILVAGAEPRWRAPYVGGSMLALAIVGTVLVLDAVALGGATTWGEGRGFIDAEPLRPMALSRNPIERREKFYARIMKRPPDQFVYRRAPEEYGLMVNDGLALLAPRLAPDSRISVLDFSNPFPFALQRPSPRGDALWWHVGKTFNRELHPAAPFEDTTMLMVPKWPMTPDETKALLEIYGAYIEEHFAKKAESRLWTLYQRR